MSHEMSSRGGGATAGGQIEEFQLPEPRLKVVRAVSGSSQFFRDASRAVDKVGRLPEVQAVEAEADAAEVKAGLEAWAAAVMAEMVVDAVGRVSWWLTQLGAEAEAEAEAEAAGVMPELVGSDTDSDWSVEMVSDTVGVDLAEEGWEVAVMRSDAALVAVMPWQMQSQQR